VLAELGAADVVLVQILLPIHPRWLTRCPLLVAEAVVEEVAVAGAVATHRRLPLQRLKVH